MRLPLRTRSRKHHGATQRRSATDDRWLNHMLDVAVLTALVVGSVALIITLIFG